MQLLFFCDGGIVPICDAAINDAKFSHSRRITVMNDTKNAYIAVVGIKKQHLA